MMAAAKGAGYMGSNQSLCNTGLRVLRKFTGDQKMVLRRRIGARGAAENDKSEHQQLQTLTLLSKCINRR